MLELVTLEITKVAEDIYESKSYSEVIHHLIHWCQWRLAINEKLNSLLAMSMFELCELSAFRNLITSKWVFKVKYTLSELVNQFKAHLVAHGFTQIEGVDYEEMFTLTLHFESLRLLLFLTVELDFHIQQMDVNNVYLTENLDKEIYMKLPKEYNLPKNYSCNLPVWKLCKGLYGLKQSGRIWNKRFKSALTDMGFGPISADNCVFINFDIRVIISLYVDDLLLFVKKVKAIENVKWQLKNHFRMKDLDELNIILSIQIKWEKGCISIDQGVYIRAFLKEYSLDNSKAVTTPINDYEALTPATDSDLWMNQ